jgi:sulfur-oxidizing protein SoxY
LEESLAQAIGGSQLRESDSIQLEIPEIAEDGAVVPITVESSLPDVDAILVFVEKNPTPLVARFQLGKAMDAYASLRIKMNESCDVIAVIKSGEAYFSSRKKVRVVVGGCG